MGCFSTNQELSLSIPSFSESAVPEQDAACIGKYLSEMMPVTSVTVVRFELERCDAASWTSEGEEEEGRRVRTRLETEGKEAFKTFSDDTGAALGEALDHFLKLKKDVHAIGCTLHYVNRPCGFLVVCRSGSWNGKSIQIVTTLGKLLGAAYAQRLSLENENRNSFVFNTIMNGMKASIYVSELETNRILFMNQTMKDEFGITEPEGKLCYEVLQKGMGRRCNFCPVERLLQAGENAPALQWDEVNTKTGRSYHNYDSLIHWMDGSIVHLQQSIDVTDLKTANTDELTQLLSRRPGKEALEDTLKQTREKEQTVTVCFCDINNLKLVNDQFGHAQGDRLITLVVWSVREILREGEYAFRMSGDEFVVVLRTGEKDARQRLTAAQESLCKLDSPEYDIGFSFGLVEVNGDHVVDADDVLLLADERMYEQKRKYHISHNAELLRRAAVNSPPAWECFQYDCELLYDALAASTYDYPFICNMKTGVFRYAPAMVEEFGLPGEVIDNAAAVWGSRVHESDKAAFLEANQVITDGRALSHCVEYRAMNRLGEWVWVRCRGQVELDERGDPAIFAGFISKLNFRNKIDHLTGLFNKMEFEERIRSHAETSPGSPLGVIIFGLDDLKHVNDLYNRAFGDEVLRITAQRLQALLPDGAEVYRLDGDEFGVLVPNADDRELRAISNTVNYSFEGQQEHDGKKYFCTLSGGSALFPRDADNYLQLAKFASYCLSCAKSHGKNCSVAYSPGILDHWERALEMVEDLRSSVKNLFEGFSLRYQPLVEAGTGRLLGAEALLRWVSHRFGAVSPVEFIPLLEQTGMIIPVGKWVLSTAIRRCTSWLRKHPDFILNVNLSYLQIQGMELTPFVLRILEETLFCSSNLVLELTESHFVKDNRHVQEIFDQLRGQGIRIAVDDFGTGFSSLSILKNIPADVVKIDRAFIRDIRTSSFDATFIRLVVELCHDVGLSVCLEGVETADEHEIVKNMGLDLLQGFYFGRPITAEEFEKKFFSDLALTY